MFSLRVILRTNLPMGPEFCDQNSLPSAINDRPFILLIFLYFIDECLPLFVIRFWVLERFFYM